MISLVPLVMLAGFGYLVYRWSSSGSANNAAGPSQRRARQAIQQNRAKKALTGKNAVARTAVAQY
jgi:hypothetical protein